jgi:tryptophan synthase alpha chain
VSGIERIAAAFAAASPRAAVMPYLMAGFPDLPTARAIGEACADAGADLLELGAPFSDPLADGPVIQAAGTAALRAGTSFDDVLELVDSLAQRLPVVVMAYSNPLYARGLQRAAADLAAAGAAGAIVPDLPLEESAELRAACEQHGLALVPLVAPTTPDARLREIGAVARGFLYTVSVTGTTGERERTDTALRTLIARAAASTEVPVAVGFGIGSAAAAAAAAAAGADGVIVGSRLVRAVQEARHGEEPAAVGALVAELRSALEGAATPIRSSDPRADPGTII